MLDGVLIVLQLVDRFARMAVYTVRLEYHSRHTFDEYESQRFIDQNARRPYRKRTANPIGVRNGQANNSAGLITKTAAFSTVMSFYQLIVP